MRELVNILKLLADETRLRILSLAAQAALNVTEFTTILGLAQSGVSRHLRQLKDSGILQERKDGIWCYYQLLPPDQQPESFKLWLRSLEQQLKSIEDPFGDQSRLMEILKQREEEVGPGLSERLLEPGQSWRTWGHALTHLMPKLDVVDLGCGDGTLTLEMARFARSVIAVDYNPERTQSIQEKITKLGICHIKVLTESLESLSIPSASADVAFLFQTLHHLEKPMDGLTQSYRILRPGGRLIVVELEAHQEEWVREKLGHYWLGFPQQRLQQMLHTTQFQQIQLEVPPQRRGEVFRVLVATGIK